MKSEKSVRENICYHELLEKSVSNFLLYTIILQGILQEG